MNDGVVLIISTPLVRVILKEVHVDLIGWPAEQLSGREGCRSSFRVELGPQRDPRHTVDPVRVHELASAGGVYVFQTTVHVEVIA